MRPASQRTSQAFSFELNLPAPLLMRVLREDGGFRTVYEHSAHHEREVLGISVGPR